MKHKKTAKYIAFSLLNSIAVALVMVFFGTIVGLSEGIILASCFLSGMFVINPLTKWMLKKGEKDE